MGTKNWLECFLASSKPTHWFFFGFNTNQTATPSPTHMAPDRELVPGTLFTGATLVGGKGIYALLEHFSPTFGFPSRGFRVPSTSEARHGAYAAAGGGAPNLHGLRAGGHEPQRSKGLAAIFVIQQGANLRETKKQQNKPNLKRFPCQKPVEEASELV